MKVRFIADARVELGSGDGRIVVVSHRSGDEVELADGLGQLFLSSGKAIRLKRSERAVKPRGEQR